MPLIDYKDEITGEVFEILIRTGDVPEECENPSTKNKAKRIYSGNIKPIFKGSGFYETDYKNNNKNY